MKLFKKAFLVLLVAFLMTNQAHAYLDPNSGSILLQILLGGVAGIALAFRMFWGNIKNFFNFRHKGDTKPNTEIEDTQPK